MILEKLWLCLILSLASACQFPELPETLLKLAPSYEVTSSVNTFGCFLAVSNQTMWGMSLSKESLVRFAYDPVNVNVVITLRTKTKLVSRKTATVDSHNIITARLKPGVYYLVMDFEAELQEDESEEENTEDCMQPYTYLSVAIAPLTELVTLSKTDLNSFKSGLPELDFETEMDEFRSYKLVDTSRYIDVTSISDDLVAVLASFPVTARKPTEDESATGHTGIWKLSFSIHHEFIEFGGVAILLQKEDVAVPNSLACVETGACIVSHQSEKNSALLVASVVPGNYTLLVVYLGISNTERDTLKEFQGGYLPFSVNFLLEPITEREDRFNCEAGRLPVSLNVPGLMSDDGFLSFHDSLYADIYAVSLLTHLTLAHDSVLRLVTVEPSGVGVDVRLLGPTGSAIAVSQSVGGTEGIVVELAKGGYSFEFVFANTMIANPRHVFCETFLLELDVMPQAAAEEYVSTHELDECARDDSANIASLLDTKFKSMKTTAEKSFLVEADEDNFFMLPIKSIAKGEETIFSQELEIYKSSYIFFEIFSHPVLADLTVILQQKVSKEKTEDVFGDLTNTLSLERHSRRSFHGQINPGKYVFSIKTGPGTKGKKSIAVQKENADSAFKVLPKCVAFQLKSELILMLEQRFNKWRCSGTDFSLSPATLNTVDKLGIKGQNQAFMPEVNYFGQKLLPPDTRKNMKPDPVAIYLDKDSYIRVSYSASHGGIFLSLKSGKQELQRVGKRTLEEGEPVVLGANLQSHKLYVLEMYYHQIDVEECQTFDMSVEIRTVQSLYSSKSLGSCTEKLPTAATLVRVRTLATLSPEFEMSTGEYSSSIHDTEYQYFHSSENVKITVPFEVKNEVAIVSAHLQASFLETGLRFYIEDEEGTVVEYGTFESSHRIETYAAPLTAGQYNIIFLETGFGPQNICNHFSAAVLIESEDQWDSYDALLRKTNDCGFADFPKSLNIIGELEEGSIHWHRKLPLDAKTQGHRFPFVLEKPSIFRLAVERVPDVVFQSRLALVTMSPYKSLVSKDPVRGIHIKLDTGSYYLDIVYGSASELPKVIECEEFGIDLQIVPEDVYTQLAEMSTCATPLPLPAVLKKPGEVKAHLITDAPIDTRIKLDLSISSHVRFQLSYESALTGPLTLHLYDAQNTRVAFSAGVQDYSSLATSVPAGKYMLRVLGTIVGNEFERVCAKISFWYFNEETELAAEECEGAELPEKLYTEETRPFGGPQEKDGSLSFYGVFRFPETKKAEKVYLRVGETSIARVLSMTSASGTSVEIMLYRDTRMTKVLGFSKNAGRAGSFILSLEAKYEPYVMELTYSKHTSQSKCPTFELAIEVERKEAVREKLTCDQALKVRSLLPDMRTSLSGKETKGGENFTIRSEWLIGDSKNFPQGVTSPGTKNSKFSYEMQIDIKSPGRFSVTTEFDFLTNDIYLKLQKGDQVLGHSQWEVLGDQLGENLELASILEDIPVEAGVYTLVLKQAVAANHLVQIFSGVPLCFYFSFSMEFEAIAMEVIDEEDKVNKLVDVIPNDKFDINPSKGLAILMTWEHPFVKGKNGSFLKAFALENEKLAKVHPNSIRQEKAKPQKLEITFKPGQLPLGSCFMLKLDVTHLDLSSDDIPPEFDFFGAHQYCTGNCACNPKAEAKCNSEMECVCPSPYTGVTCEECIDGYTFEESKICIKDECANCPDACVNGKCQAAPPCQCGDYGECVKNKCKCKTGYTGEKCDSCEDGELVFPDCAPCGYDLLPVNITYSENMDKGKNGLNRKGEFQFSAERVEKKTQSISFRLQKGSMVQIDITDSLKDTKVLIADFTRKPIKPLSDETNESVRSAKWYLQGGRQYSMVIVGKARQRCAAFAVDISITPSDPPAELPKVKKEEQVTEKSSTSEQSSLRSSEATDCQGHGRRRADGSCACDVGYIGSSCGKCDDGFEMRPSGACLQKVAPPISLQNVVTAPPRVKYIQPETNWTTTIVGLCVCVICFYAVYRIYQAKSNGEQRWHHRPLNTSGFDGPEDEDEEERRSLHERSRRRAQDPTL